MIRVVAKQIFKNKYLKNNIHGFFYIINSL